MLNTLVNGKFIVNNEYTDEWILDFCEETKSKKILHYPFINTRPEIGKTAYHLMINKTLNVWLVFVNYKNGERIFRCTYYE